jgi:hypothetical protein
MLQKKIFQGPIQSVTACIMFCLVLSGAAAGGDINFNFEIRGVAE